MLLFHLQESPNLTVALAKGLVSKRSNILPPPSPSFETIDTPKSNISANDSEESLQGSDDMEHDNFLKQPLSRGYSRPGSPLANSMSAPPIGSVAFPFEFPTELFPPKQASRIFDLDDDILISLQHSWDKACAAASRTEDYGGDFDTCGSARTSVSQQMPGKPSDYIPTSQPPQFTRSSSFRKSSRASNSSDTKPRQSTVSILRKGSRLLTGLDNHEGTFV